MPPTVPYGQPNIPPASSDMRPATVRPARQATIHVPPARPTPPARPPQRPQPAAPTTPTPPKATSPQARPPVQASQTAVEQTPIFQLRQPVKVQSALLGETILFVANDVLAEPLRQDGPVPYTSREIVLLSRIRVHSAPTDWPAHLRLIHEAKQLLGGTLVEYTPAAMTPSHAQPHAKVSA